MRSSLIDTHRSPDARIHDPRYKRSFSSQMPVSHRYGQRVGLSSWMGQFVLAPSEGWLPLILLAIALYSVVGSIIAVGWVGHSSLLLFSPAAGLLVGLIISKIPRFPQVILHLAACLIGHWLAVWLTSSVAYHIHWLLLLSGIRAAFTGGFSAGASPTGEIVFFFYLAFLCFFLGYFGSWLVYRAHLPWLVALVYSSILLVNLSYVKADLGYLIVILAGSLLLLIARMQLVTQILQWTQEGLYTNHAWRRMITWRVMQFASVLTLLALVISWLLPIQTQSDGGKTFWGQVDNAVNNLVNGRVSLQNPASLVQPFQDTANFFADQLTITGSVHLPTGEVLFYTSDGGVPRYLEGFTYNQFDGHTWTTSLTTADAHIYVANSSLMADTTMGDFPDQTTTITITQPPEGSKHYIFGPAQPVSFDVSTIVYDDGTAAAWTQTTPLVKGESYHVISMIPPSDGPDLSNIPLPADNPNLWHADVNYEQLATNYMQLPHDLSPRVALLAKQWTQGASDTYSALKMLEAHLSDPKVFTYSVDNPPVPNNVDVVDVLLQTRSGYCTYYASAMTVMARMLGIPTRIVNGFSRGHLDPQRHVWSVDGSDAHSWVQAYFPGSGWISFDPTPGFSSNAAPQQNPPTVPTPTTTKPTVKPTPAVALHHGKSTPPPAIPPNGPHSGSQAAQKSPVISPTLLMALSVGSLLFSLMLLIIAIVTYWWRNLYATSPFAARMFWRFCRIASWAGLAPKAWQTPYEYSGMLSWHFSRPPTPLWRLTELFVRDRWGPPQATMQVQEEEAIERHWSALRRMLPSLFFKKSKRP